MNFRCSLYLLYIFLFLLIRAVCFVLEKGYWTILGTQCVQRSSLGMQNHINRLQVCLWCELLTHYWMLVIQWAGVPNLIYLFIGLISHDCIKHYQCVLNISHYDGFFINFVTGSLTLYFYRYFLIVYSLNMYIILFDVLPLFLLLLFYLHKTI